MVKRVVFGFIGALYLVLMFSVGSWFFNLSILLFALIGLKEFYNAFRHHGFKPLNRLGYLFIIIFFTMHILYEGRFDFGLLILGIIVAMSSPILKPSITPVDAGLTIWGFIYPGIIFLFVILLKDQVFPYGHHLLVLTLITTFSTDSFAYFVGVTMGKTKLCPKISPKKTVEGSLGGLVGSILMALLFGFLFNRVYNLDIPLFHYLFIGLLTGVLSQLGDLSASVIKRFCDIKDFGNVLPGHGGILDRFDSLLFTAPVIYVYYLLILAP